MLRHGELFAVFDRHGDALPSEAGSHGFYSGGTRHLSGFSLWVEDKRPALLGSTLRDDDALLTVDLSNPVLEGDGRAPVFRDTIHLFRSRFACDDTFYEVLRVTNHGSDEVRVALSFRVHADFADIFEVRGMRRKTRGEMLVPQIRPTGLELRYRGMDGGVRATVLRCQPDPDHVTDSEIGYELSIGAKETREIRVSITCLVDGPSFRGPARSYEQAFERTCAQLDSARARSCRIRTSHESLNDWIARSASDLRMMTSETPHGIYPYAGVPWFNAIFGRDGLISARQLLWVDPTLARGVLRTLAGTQARTRSDARDSEPGKIVHEIRGGEMAALGEVPFGCYYGTVDATPLFIMLARDYHALSGDTATIQELWPSLLSALEWIDRHGDPDGDGFVEYHRRAVDGLVHQGWKDSDDAVFHDDGRMAEGPIALCEVQGYAYAARMAISELASLLGDAALSRQQRQEADALRRRFTDAFWCEDLGTFALALDGEKQPCRVRTSNAGHCLYAGIASDEQAQRITSNLMAEDSFSGWGVRTVSARERRYNPMAYHNGSVWPHDTAIVAAGMTKYGAREPVLRLLDGLFHASAFMELNRMPELFCGFHARAGQGPTLYPMACAPQAWAAGSVFLLLEACLGLEVHGASRTVILRRPVMPAWLDWIELSGLTVGDTIVDLLVRRARSGVAIELLRKLGDATIQVTKTL